LVLFSAVSIYLFKVKKMTIVKNDFDAAKEVYELLANMDKERQQRVLRWVAESLDISLHTKPHGAQAQGHQTAISSSAEVNPHVIAHASSIDIKSFIDSKQPKSDTQFAAATAYYYRFEAMSDDRKESINAEILQNAARLASRARFVKPLMTLNNAKNQGYLDAAERGAFRINNVGENLVAMTLPGTTNTAAARAKRVSKPKTVTKKTKK
jgi:hypothetical protein